MSKKLLNFLKYLIGWPLSILALFFVFRIVLANVPKISFDIALINIPLLILSIILFVIYFFLRGFLWMIILGENSRHFSFKENLLHWSTSELKRYIPGNIWSFIARATSFEKETLSKKQVLIFIGHEAIIVIISSLFISLFFVWNFYQSLLLKYGFLFLFILLAFTFLLSSFVLGFLKGRERLEKFAQVFLSERGFFENLKVLLLGILTFSVFSLATYFSVISLFNIDFKYFLPLISLFSFSLFIGYVSFITPMGLGIREAVITTGLSAFIMESFAAISSIFTRIIFIVSELLSLILIIAWNKLNFSLVKRMEKFIANHKHETLLVIFVFIYILYYTTASFLRYDNFFTGRFDLGNMDQTVWNTINGRLFQLTDPNGTGVISRLSIHADFILILISPLYLIWESPKMLLLLQTIILSFGAFFVYLISKEILKNKNISLVFGAIYLLNPAVGFTNLYDFHAVTLATTFLLAAFYYFLKRKYVFFLIFAVLSGITKEQIWLVISIFGLFIAGRIFLENRKNYKEFLFGVFLFFAGAVTAYALIAQIMPVFRGSEHFAVSYFSDFGDSPFRIISGIISDPLKTLSIILEKERLTYLNQLLSPLGYLSVFSPIYLIFALPDLTINLLSKNPALHQIYYQYSAVITPFIFISAIYTSRFFSKTIKKLDFGKISVYILITSLFSLYLTGPIIGSKKANIDMFSKQLPNREVIENYISSIPKEHSIAATNNLGSHLSQREYIYTIPNGMDKADIVVFLLNDVFAQPSLEAQRIMAATLKNHPDYALVLQDGDFIAFKRLK